MMKPHFKKIIVSFTHEMSKQTTDMVPHCDEEVLLDLIRMLWVRKLFKASEEITFAA